MNVVRAHNTDTAIKLDFKWLFLSLALYLYLECVVSCRVNSFLGDNMAVIQTALWYVIIFVSPCLSAHYNYTHGLLWKSLPAMIRARWVESKNKERRNARAHISKHTQIMCDHRKCWSVNDLTDHQFVIILYWCSLLSCLRATGGSLPRTCTYCSLSPVYCRRISDKRKCTYNNDLN